MKIKQILPKFTFSAIHIYQNFDQNTLFFPFFLSFLFPSVTVWFMQTLNPFIFPSSSSSPKNYFFTLHVCHILSHFENQSSDDYNLPYNTYGQDFPIRVCNTCSIFSLQTSCVGRYSPKKFARHLTTTANHTNRIVPMHRRRQSIIVSYRSACC